MSDEPAQDRQELIVFCIPSLVATLLNRERSKGSALTEAEVIEIRDGCPAKMLTPAEARAVEARRGYKDIDPGHCWEQWQEARLEFFVEPGDEAGEEPGSAAEESGSVSPLPPAGSGDLIVFIDPSLVGLLYAREFEKGSALTEEEVIGIRDSSPAMVLAPEDVREREAARGFKDIDPERCWEEWQQVRLTLLHAPRE